MTDVIPQVFNELLLRWQAFSELQQRAFAFLANEALESGREFENSTEGATAILAQLGGGSDGDMQAEIWAVVSRLQAADRSRQGLEQVASVLTTLKQQHADLVDLTKSAVMPLTAEAMTEEWIRAIAANICLVDWRRRLEDALHGREPCLAPDSACSVEDELF